MVGTGTSTVTPWRSMRSRLTAGSNDGSTTMVPPSHTRPSSGAVPATWKSGATASSTSSRSRPQASVLWNALATRFRWVSTTPLDRPVVPPVKKMAAGSSSDVAPATAAPRPVDPGRRERRARLGRRGRAGQQRLVLGAEADGRLHRLAQRAGVPVGQEDAGARAAQGVEQLGLGVAGVEGHDHEAGGGQREVGLHVPVAAGGQHGHAVAALQPERGQGRGQAACSGRGASRSRTARRRR